MAQYNSVLVRQNLADQGILPRTGGWTACPDLIQAGTAPITDPQGTFGSTASMATDPTQPVVQQAPNYVYMRGTNLGTQATTAEARVFYAPQHLFLYPSQWLDNQMQTSSGASVSEIASIAPNGVGVTTDPLVWIPPTTDEHYCLIGFISTPAVSFASQQPPNAVSSLDGLATWIGATGGTGWHNVQWAANSATFSNTATWNPSSKAETVQMTITCTGLPIGSQVSFSCGTPVNGKYINLPPTTVNTNDTIGFFVPVDLPAGWTSTITYTYTSNGGAPLPTFSLAVSGSVVKTSEDQAFAEYARSSDEVFPNHVQFDLVSGDLLDPGKPMPVNYIVPCGSDTTLMAPGAAG